MKNKLILAILLTVFTISASACQTQREQTTIQDGNSISEDSNADSSDTTDNGSSNDNNASTDLTDSEDSAASDVPSAEETFAMEEQTLLEYEGLTLKALSWDSEAASLKIQAENSSDADYIVQLINTSVNDFMMESSFSMNVNAAAQSEKDAEFSVTDLESCEIKNVTEIQTQFLLLNSVSFETLYTSDVITIQTGDPSAQQEYDESGDVLYEQNGLIIRSHGFTDDSNLGKLWKLYISNNSGQDFCFYSPDVTLNNSTMDVLFSVTVPDGKKAVASMTIFKEDLDKYQITDITSAQLTLQLQDPETFDTIQTIDNLSLEF